MKLYRQIILLTLALLVLVSTTGMAVGMHVCGGEIQDISLLGKAQPCSMDPEQQELPPCLKNQHKQAKDNHCCESHSLIVKRLDAGSDTKITLHRALDLKFIAAVKAVILQLFVPETAATPAYALYTSPPLARDIPVLVQSFLI